MLIIISGLPGTGKTTFAGALAERLQATHLNSDMIREELNKRGRYDPETKALIYERMRDRTEACLKEGKTVIVDATFYQEAYRKPYIQLSKSLDQPLKWIELKAKEATIQNRVSRKREHSEADFSVYRKVKKAYEPLSIEHLVLSSDENEIDKMLDQAMHYLH